MHTIGNNTYSDLYITSEWGLNIQDKEADSEAIFNFIEEIQYDIIFIEGQFNPNQCNHLLLKPRLNENNNI
jgi:hypothetical protein